MSLRSAAAGAFAAVAVLATAACSGGSTAAEAESSATATASSSASAEAAAFPRTITHESGETTLEAEPERIVSTSITLTGTLLAIDAPVVGTAATTVTEGMTDDNGFFAQWADVAVAQGVEPLYTLNDDGPDLEAIIAAEPDLIVASTTGYEAAAEFYDELSAIAPTIVVNYSDKTWQDLALEMGTWTGNEAEAEAVVAEFDAAVEEAAAAITIPEGAVAQGIVFNNLEYDSAVAKIGGTHVTLLESLGFEVVDADEALDTYEGARDDFMFVSPENLPEAFTGDIIFLINGTDTQKEALLSTELLANVPAVETGDVYPLGATSFRIDYYSSLMIVEDVVEAFGA
ncbi:Fe2+-enterobactin ABC transporter substrate-binding protein [Demequina sp. NBRC 110054]|uniref:Fe2+-enterobactin ABC transporter substrate-binding protein n=1 Tax=Demequina sp. NBRC 110054 TaxID=1570343 RepID=UPI0009FED073|nr:Fe2+-enterobactin ABC transporter substrate-binding protein [Demequina sp. NBRC 110054]